MVGSKMKGNTNNVLENIVNRIRVFIRSAYPLRSFLLCPLKLKGQFTQKHIHLFQQVFQIKNNQFVHPSIPEQLI